jgi:hypothetical protein
MDVMRSTLEDGLRALREATELAKSIHPTVDDQYREWILQIEALPENQSGSDKTWVWEAQQTFLDFFKLPRRTVRRR